MVIENRMDLKADREWLPPSQQTYIHREIHFHSEPNLKIEMKKTTPNTHFSISLLSSLICIERRMIITSTSTFWMDFLPSSSEGITFPNSYSTKIGIKVRKEIGKYNLLPCLEALLETRILYFSIPIHSFSTHFSLSPFLHFKGRKSNLQPESE